MSDIRKAAELAKDIKDAVLELSDGHRFPDLMDAIDHLAALSQPAEAKGEPVQVPEDERNAFERWFEGNRCLPGENWFRRDIDEPEEYLSTHTAEAWDGWKARAMLAAAPLPPAKPKPQHDTDMEQRWPNAVTPAEHPQKTVNRRLLEALRYCIKQVPELATVPGVNCAIAEAEAQMADHFVGASKMVSLDDEQIDAAFLRGFKAAQSQLQAAQPVGREALSRQTLIGLWGDKSDGPSNSEIVDFGRAVERAHGITGEGEA